MSSPSTIITVSDLTQAIKNQLESRFLSLSIQGEISNLKLHSSGHLYFDLKDERAKISAVLFRAKLKNIPKEGDKVIVRGSITVYPPHGKYQLLATSIEFAGEGELLLKFENLKKKLLEKGWFDQDKKKKLPKFPKTIGVVTSPTGAVIRDIIQVLSRRCSGFHLLLYPVKVQGEGAAMEIATAISELNRYCLADVLIVGRGGGSIEDLWAFNEECVAKAIFESSIPIVSAVGHETDITLADFVADQRAPTPSAAAEIISSETSQSLENLSKMQKSLRLALLHRLSTYRTRLEGIRKNSCFASSQAMLNLPIQKLDELKNRLDEKMKQTLLQIRYQLEGHKKHALAVKPSAQIAGMRQKLSLIENRLENSFSTFLIHKKQGIKEIIQQLNVLDPKKVLKRGYSILFALNEGSVIESAKDLTAGKKIKAKLSDGEALLTVDHE